MELYFPLIIYVPSDYTAFYNRAEQALLLIML
mgnify:CR=1 FL=1